MSRHWLSVLLQDVIDWMVEIGEQAIYVWRRVTTTAIETGKRTVNLTRQFTIHIHKVQRKKVE